MKENIKISKEEASLPSVVGESGSRSRKQPRHFKTKVAEDLFNVTRVNFHFSTVGSEGSIGSGGSPDDDVSNNEAAINHTADRCSHLGLSKNHLNNIHCEVSTFSMI